jgi:hypothetical protein
MIGLQPRVSSTLSAMKFLENRAGRALGNTQRAFDAVIQFDG